MDFERRRSNFKNYKSEHVAVTFLHTFMERFICRKKNKIKSEHLLICFF